jgi:hypothetical protein
MSELADQRWEQYCDQATRARQPRLLVAGTDFRIMARAEGYAMVTVPSVPGVPFVVDERRIAGLGGVARGQRWPRPWLPEAKPTAGSGYTE